MDSNAGANILGVRFFSKIKKVNKTEREAGRAWRERQRCIEVGEEPEEEEEVVEEKKEFNIEDFRKNVLRCVEGMKIQLADVTNDRLKTIPDFIPLMSMIAVRSMTN